jgi:enoyl-CoA hydratase/carnithine racemase
MALPDILSALPRGEGAIRLFRDGALAFLWIDHPSRKNALSPGMMCDLVEAVDALAADPPLAVILAGVAPGGFCAGGDLHAVAAQLMRPEAAAAMVHTMTAVTERLRALPLLRLAAVEGAALGGGAELMSVADLIFAGQGAQIGFIQAALGVSPGWGGGQRLIARLGRAKALRVLLEARRLSAEEALSIGLIDEVTPDGGAVEAALAFVSRLRAPPAALRGALRLVADPAREAEVFLSLWGQPAHAAALQKALRRSPAGD